MIDKYPINTKDLHIFIVGSNARLAKAIIKYYKNCEIILIEREVYRGWGNVESRESIFNFFKNKLCENSIIFITSGILNSKEDFKSIESVNYYLPWNIIRALEGIDSRIITFGTILEKIRNTQNSYIKSKIKLSDKIEKFKSNTTNVTHFQLHTLYGYGLPSSFMFLGQIYNSLKNNLEFKMSSGFQFREYHHLDDVVKSVDFILSHNEKGVIEITSGNGIMLRNLALEIFKKFKCRSLLKISAINDIKNEKLSNDYQKNNNLKNIDFRDPIEGVCHYLESIL